MIDQSQCKAANALGLINSQVVGRELCEQIIDNRERVGKATLLNQHERALT